MDYKEFLEQLQTTLTSAVDKLPSGSEGDKSTENDGETAKAIAEVKTAVDAVTKALTTTEGDDQSPLIKVLDELTEDNKAYRDLFEKVFDRLENIEKGTAVKKSLNGQEGDGDGDGEKGEKKTVEKAGEAGMAQAFSSLMKNGKVTLN